MKRKERNYCRTVRAQNTLRCCARDVTEAVGYKIDNTHASGLNNGSNLTACKIRKQHLSPDPSTHTFICKYYSGGS